MFSRSLSWYLLKSWNNTPNRRRSCSGSQVDSSRPSSTMRPSLGSYRPANSLTNVVFPAPFSPTKAMLSPGAITRSMWRKAQLSLPG